METKETTENISPKETTENDVIARLAGKGEQAIHRLVELPGGSRALKGFNDLKERVDDLTKRMRGIDALEKRVAKLEQDLAALRREQPAPAERKRTPTATPKATP